MPLDSKLLPLTDTETFVLAGLQGNGPLHGYALLKAILALSNGEINLPVSNLYATMPKLLKMGLVERADDVQEGDPRRRPYRITELGRQILAEDFRRREQTNNMLRPVLRPS